MIEKEIEAITTVVEALKAIAQRSPEYKPLCSECITDLIAVNHNLQAVNDFVNRAKVLLGED